MRETLIQVEPRVQEEPPIEESWENAEVRVEQLDDSPHYPNYPSPAAEETVPRHPRALPSRANPPPTLPHNSKF